MADQPQTLNIPSLLFVIVIIGLSIRYFFFSSSSPSTRRPYSSPPRIRFNPSQVEQIENMFPQIGRREIMWELQRNGGSVAAATERILGGNLETPPPSFQPFLPPSATAQAQAQKPTHPDLITRYNLASRLNSQSPSSNQESKPAPMWSNDRNERQALLQRRREEMVLKARRQLEEEEARKADR